jgi:hypothetical protein
MTAARKYTLIWILLPLLALRGLVPAGFMVDTSGGTLSIVMCGGTGPLATGLSHGSGHAVHQMDHGQMDHSQMDPGHQHAALHSDGQASHHGSDHEHKNSICPFAIAGSAATLAHIPSLPAAIEPVRVVAATHIVALHGLFGPSRVQQSRAPPSISLVS